jgi:uncharacterized protein YyaL (SSP411 family)
MASAGERTAGGRALNSVSPILQASIDRLIEWLEAHDYRGYDTFDGLNARFVRPLTFETTLLRTVLLQGVRRFPLNLRPLLGVRPDHSSKGMGFLARGFMRMHKATGDPAYAEKARFMLQWLIDHRSPGYSGACWGNHFDYQSRTFFLPKGVPTVVWTALIGHAFLDAGEHFGDARYLEIAVSACEHILADLAVIADGEGGCIVYVPGTKTQVHNANTLGGSLLARTFRATGDERYRALAERSIRYTAQHQLSDGAWYYGEKDNLHWVDNFHTGYVLDCFEHYARSTGDEQFMSSMLKGFQYWKSTFFLDDGTPRYYNHKTLPIDIQCASQAIDTLVAFRDYDSESLQLAIKVTEWTIGKMQDKTGYFYYRRYGRNIVNKTPTLHWGQATMLSALAGLYQLLQ